MGALLTAPGTCAGISVLRCGRIAYTNDLPVYAAFDEGVLQFPGTLHADVPTQLNSMLVEGHLALSPISAFAYAEHADDLVLLPDLCIAAKGEVLSVLLVSEVPPALLDGATVAVTRESASGANLLNILLQRRYGVRARFIFEDDPLSVSLRQKLPALLIGDRAIDARYQVPAEHIYDLGRLWYEWTGEASVFAVWAARRDAFERDREGVDRCMEALREALVWGNQHRQNVIGRAERMHPRGPGFYEHYYAKLNFHLDGEGRRGLQRYFAELHAIGAIKKIPASQAEVSGVSG